MPAPPHAALSALFHAASLRGLSVQNTEASARKYRSFSNEPVVDLLPCLGSPRLRQR